MGDIFSYARYKIKTKYENLYDDSLEDELWEIDYYEKNAKSSWFIEAISYRIRAFWYVQEDDVKVFIGSGIALILFTLFVFLHGINDVPLNILTLNASHSFFTCVKVLGIIFIYRLLRQKIIKSKMFYLGWVLTLLLSIPYLPVFCGYETTQIGDFYEAKEYKETYYVIMSEQPSEVENRKVYILPTEIERRFDYSHDAGMYEVETLNYHINRIDFPNGGYLTFDDATYSIVQVGRETEVIDDHDDFYYITLTREKVK